jgi:hypothetical protein
MIIKIVKNWLDDLCMNCMQNKNTKDYLKVEGSLINDNYELIEKSKYLKIWIWMVISNAHVFFNF